MRKAELELARKLADAEIDWPGMTDPGEPDPTMAELDAGWAEVEKIEAKYAARFGAERAEMVSTAVGEAAADYGRAGWRREEVRERLYEMIEDPEGWDEDE